MEKNNKLIPEFLTVEQISELLHIHWQTTLEYIRRGDIKAFKLGKGWRVTREDFDDFIRRQKERGGKK